ncbi:MAG TPA: CHAD domain-containing protein, partial [Gemmatimonadales bacterium]|nr:CHAD domain-containing protein [Gemmatimonadales bacterium]
MARPALNPGLLGRPAREGARAVALQYLRHALEEAARLSVRAGERSGSALCQESGTEDDAEAVHDFRVALRRLRSWLQAFRSFLDDTVTQRSERRLKRLSRQAGAARDLQVQRVILCELTGDSLVTLEARRIAGLLARDEARARKRLIQATLERLPPTAGDLAEQLHRGSVAALPAPGHTMALVMARLLAAALERVETALPRVKQAGQVVAAHEARIAIKQLRYLLECLGRSSRLAAAAASSLATLQNA